jgi:two-component sensor histidine kinase
MSVHRLQTRPDLAGEADHRIANSLATISGLVRLRAKSMHASDDPKRFLMEIADRIETLAELHRLMAQSENDRVQIASYLHQVCDKLNLALGSAKSSITISCSADHAVPFRVALPLGLIAGELFSNSLKYAHPAGLPTKVTISFESDHDGIHIIYEDDGVGFPEDFDFSRGGNLGLRFIHSLVSQLGGVHEWSSDPLGIRFDLRVPVAANVTRGNFICSREQAPDARAETEQEGSAAREK